MDFRLLGALEVSAGGVAADLGPPKQRALLAILVLHVGEIVPIDRLIELLWGDSPPRTANHSIQIYVSDLRKAFEALGAKGVLSTRSPGYQLNADADSIDIRQFEARVREGRRKLREGDPDTGAAELRTALRLWRGPAFSDFTYEEFAQPPPPLDRHRTTRYAASGDPARTRTARRVASAIDSVATMRHQQPSSCQR